MLKVSLAGKKVNITHTVSTINNVSILSYPDEVAAEWFLARVDCGKNVNVLSKLFLETI